MQRINELLSKSREAQAQATQKATKSDAANRLRMLGKLIKDNSSGATAITRYVLYGVIILKSVSIYDKMKQLVAINQMHAAIIQSKSESLRRHFSSEEELQDMLTKRLLEASMINDDENDLGEDDNAKFEASGMMSPEAKAKTRKGF